MKAFKLPVSLEKHHIDHGVEGDCSMCAGALAIRDAFENHELAPDDLNFDVTVSRDVTLWWDGPKYEAPIPPKLGSLIQRFDSGDRGIRVKPITFELEFEEVEA